MLRIRKPSESTLESQQGLIENMVGYTTCLFLLQVRTVFGFVSFFIDRGGNFLKGDPEVPVSALKTLRPNFFPRS